MPDGRLGPWQPTTLEERVDRMESLAAIQQLVSRYARALDARDMDALVELFDPEVRVGADRRGRSALHEWMSAMMSHMRTSVHLVATHVVDFDDADHARGIVSCRDELERPELGQWVVGAIQYWDDYVRIEDEWCFSRRRLHRWYLVDALERPAPGAGLNTFGEHIREGRLPDAYPSWAAYWDTWGRPPEGD